MMQAPVDPNSALGTDEVAVDRDALGTSIAAFAGRNGRYYAQVFHKLHESTGRLPVSFNPAAGLLGPFWSSARGVWGMFWGFLFLEIIAWVQIGRGSWGNPGAEYLERAMAQSQRAQDFAERAAAARDAGKDPKNLETLAANIGRAAEENISLAEQAQSGAFAILITGIALLVFFKLLQGFCANSAYERQFSKWLISPETVENGVKIKNVLTGLFLILAVAPLTIYSFSVGAIDLLSAFPTKQISALFFTEQGTTFFSATASWFDMQIDAAARAWPGFFDSITYAISKILSVLTLALNGMPWPVVMLVICVIAWRVSGPRVSIFTGAALLYIALFGYWAVAMETVALVGAAALYCVVIGIPFGIWFGKSRKAAAVAEPILDLMQTLPAFVYLIPIIAFFGTGNPPGILATIFFGMPPVVRLTALGIRGVPETIKEAATAYGASRLRLLKDVELPLALPSIMTGVNQTILMCLSMVVIISLIGDGGLGKVILEALQYAAKGQGILGGLAILFCAMILDRIVQGAFRRQQS